MESKTAKYIIASILALLMILFSYLVWQFLNPQSTLSSATLNEWVKKHDVDPLKYAASNFLPGTLIHVDSEYRDSLAMPAGDFLSDLDSQLVVYQLPNTRLNIELRATGEINTEKKQTRENKTELGTKAEIVGTATLLLENVEMLSLPLNRLKDNIKKNTRVEEALLNSPDNLFVVLKALRVGKMSFIFNDALDASTQAEMAGKSISAVFNSQITVQTNGQVNSRSALIVGARYANLAKVSNVLGGNEFTIEIKPLDEHQLKEFRVRIANRTKRLYSTFDIHSLVIGLGNYPSGSNRAGGELLDSTNTAEFVAQSVRRLLPAHKANQVKLLTSREISIGQFDRTQRLSRRKLIEEITLFVKAVKQKADPKKQTLVLFYYFGHGLADGLYKNAYLVPERFIDDEQLEVRQMRDKLIDVKEVINLLAQATDNSILLIDACREHENEDIKYQDVAFGSTPELSRFNKAGFQFASGLYGPTPVIFGSNDGMTAPLIKLPSLGFQNGTGPLALLLWSILNQVSKEQGSLNLASILKNIKTPTKIPGTQTSVKGYTQFRTPFIPRFGQSTLFSTEAVEVQSRKKKFRASEDQLYSQLGG